MVNSIVGGFRGTPTAAERKLHETTTLHDVNIILTNLILISSVPVQLVYQAALAAADRLTPLYKSTISFSHICESPGALERMKLGLGRGVCSILQLSVRFEARQPSH